MRTILTREDPQVRAFITLNGATRFPDEQPGLRVEMSGNPWFDRSPSSNQQFVIQKVT